jgi:hypothetical protein
VLFDPERGENTSRFGNVHRLPNTTEIPDIVAMCYMHLPVLFHRVANGNPDPTFLFKYRRVLHQPFCTVGLAGDAVVVKPSTSVHCPSSLDTLRGLNALVALAERGD